MRIAGLATALLVAVACEGGVTAAEATTITETVSFTASGFSSEEGHKIPKDPVNGSFTFTLDDKKKYTDQSKGLTFKGINIAVTGPVVFSYDPSQNWFTIGANGHSNQYIWGTNDFSLSLFIHPKVSGGFFGYSQNGIDDSFETYRIAVSASSASTLVARNAVLLATTPIPGSVLMLLTALGTLAGMTCLRERALGAPTG